MIASHSVNQSIGELMMFTCELPDENAFMASFDLAGKWDAPRVSHYFKNLDKQSPIQGILLYKQNRWNYDVCKGIQLFIRKEADVPQTIWDNYREWFPKIGVLGFISSHKTFGTRFQLTLQLEEADQKLFDMILLAEIFDKINPDFIRFLERVLNSQKPECLHMVTPVLPAPVFPAIGDIPEHSLIKMPVPSDQPSSSCSSSSSTSVIAKYSSEYPGHPFFSSYNRPLEQKPPTGDFVAPSLASTASSSQPCYEIEDRLKVYLNMLDQRKEIFSDSFKRLGIKQPMKLTCPLSLSVCDKPVRVDGDLFDFDELVRLAKRLPDGRLEHPVNRLPFRLDQIQPARDIVEKLEKIIKRAEDEVKNAEAELVESSHPSP
ncbi:hypothetical protein [Legionella sp. CNM-4043-24]|uniref:hypothetical protein n=1 Tax=Legionella sp. CNM-4043-24 TaxID=3421646 RepID=UPI00403B0F41